MYVRMSERIMSGARERERGGGGAHRYTIHIHIHIHIHKYMANALHIYRKLSWEPRFRYTADLHLALTYIYIYLLGPYLLTHLHTGVHAYTIYVCM